MILERKRQGIEALIAAARKGSLVPFDQALVVVDDGLVQDLLEETMPFERDLGHGIIVRVTDAVVSFQDGLALVRLDGTARLASVSNVTVDLAVYGELTMMELDSKRELLRGRIRMIAVEERDVDVFGMRPSVKRLIEDLYDLGIESYEELNATIEIPVRLARQVKLPEVGPYGDFRIPAAAIPLRIATGDVRSLRGKLWIPLKIQVSEGGPH